MGRTSIVRTIDASSERVFETVADADRFSNVIPEIVRVEFLTEQRTGVGTRFRETRLTRGREASTDLEVTDYEAHRRIRLVADSHGTVWDTVFVVSESGGRTKLEMTMDATPYRLLPRLLNPLMGKAIRAAIEKDMDAVQAYCEGEKGG
jgi:uncharacterized protein YndB with AHSA1/START domain